MAGKYDFVALCNSDTDCGHLRPPVRIRLQANAMVVAISLPSLHDKAAIRAWLDECLLTDKE